ncbi:MAG: FliH/SctL family protein [Bacillota bacterium]
MYNKIFKSNQISVGVPVQIRAPINYQTIRRVSSHDLEDEDDLMENSEDSDKANSVTAEEILENAREEADSIIKEAQLEADRILDIAKSEADQLKLSVFEEAKQQGFEKGYEEAKMQYEDLLQEAEFVKEHAKQEYQEVLNSIENDAVNVILDIARKVIGNEISLNKESLLEMVRQAFERCSNKEDITIKVSSQDYDYIVENRDKILSMAEGIGKLDIKKDPSLKVGACIIETPYGSVDAGVQTKLKKIEEAFIKVIGK